MNGSRSCSAWRLLCTQGTLYQMSVPTPPPCGKGPVSEGNLPIAGWSRNAVTVCIGCGLRQITLTCYVGCRETQNEKSYKKEITEEVFCANEFGTFLVVSGDCNIHTHTPNCTGCTKNHHCCSRHRRQNRIFSLIARFRTVVLNLGSRDPLGVPNANLGGPKRKSGISTNFPRYK